jgi:hypothetical protein
MVGFPLNLSKRWDEEIGPMPERRSPEESEPISLREWTGTLQSGRSSNAAENVSSFIKVHRKQG